MKQKSNRKLIILTVIITAVISGAAFFALFNLTGILPNSARHGDVVGQPETEKTGSKERKIIYWQAPMNPTEIYDNPGKSKMGMDLVPVYEDDVADDSKSKDRKIVYWKAPMNPTEIYEQPGKSKMGMDLVPVYEDELVGGVDIKIDPVVEQNMGLKIETARKGPLHHAIKTYGHITFDETRTGIVSQKTGGWIEKLYADYTGLFVKKGQPLYEIYSPSLLASQEEYLSAFKNYQKNKTSLNMEILSSARKRLGYFDIADMEIAAIEKSGEVKKSLVVRSPYTGVITQKNIIEGAFAKPGESLFIISDLSFVWVEAHIFEYEQNLVFKDQEVEMTLSYDPEKTYTGKISYIFPYLQKKTRDVIIRIAFENKNSDLKPDMFVKININTGQLREGISIPSEAVVYSGEEKIVFVAKGKGKYTPRRIQTGVYLDNGRVEVLSGLAREDQVVVSGQFLLDSESKLKEAIQKMIESKSAPAKDDKDDFFNDMETKDDFFKDMK
ncbi:MAG: efflux RND transporter periplasmic adaptor subunit [Proteobacteria bacterium]|nr:efflux RND transporter periplasmic adaptor subunit [Pseudomonadota bacterium]MBU1584596.1 efflux RND transporter periplasmic adaptor subunit [Pseudomonadota bacterium]MBU2452470.1 efflux RND transporter periplasmic adaptor subunit [Pseudomonadota bacterium]MBU2629358.1 efflux RND transporter periplasmic adaptor subunit [Pseudomonadota bacterium]